MASASRSSCRASPSNAVPLACVGLPHSYRLRILSARIATGSTSGAFTSPAFVHHLTAYPGEHAIVGQRAFDSPAPSLSCMCSVTKPISVRSTRLVCQFSSLRAARRNDRTAGAQAILSKRLRPFRSRARAARPMDINLSSTCSTPAGFSLDAVNSQARGLTSIPTLSRPSTVAVNGPLPRPQNGSRTRSPRRVRPSMAS